MGTDDSDTQQPEDPYAEIRQSMLRSTGTLNQFVAGLEQTVAELPSELSSVEAADHIRRLYGLIAVAFDTDFDTARLHEMHGMSVDVLVERLDGLEARIARLE